jgi:hypothetical protein
MDGDECALGVLVHFFDDWFVCVLRDQRAGREDGQGKTETRQGKTGTRQHSSPLSQPCAADGEALERMSIP